MILTGIADESGESIERQILAHQELGWSAIELRTVHGRNVASSLSDCDFDRVVDAVTEAGLVVPAFASEIGNWSRSIASGFEQDVEDLRRAIPRMNRLGARYLRTMSWVGDGVADHRWRREAIRRYRELSRIAADGGIYLAHENCTGWAGQSADHTRQLIEEVSSDHLVVLFDIGNTISHGHEPWTFYSGIKDLIRYLHLKDCRRNPDGGRSQDYTYPGDGDAMVREVIGDLLSSGYDGVISIEPHIAKVIHDATSLPNPHRMYASYLEYARRFVELVKNVRKELVAT